MVCGKMKANSLSSFSIKRREVAMMIIEKQKLNIGFALNGK